ncbi:MAG: hypothetical protein ABSC02_07860 [Acidobacteriota bacterium]
MKTYGQKLAVNPSGLLIYHPPGARSLEVSQFVTEFLAELFESLIVVILLSRTWCGATSPGWRSWRLRVSWPASRNILRDGKKRSIPLAEAKRRLGLS